MTVLDATASGTGREDPGEAERVETLVIGGGQAGLAAGYHLARRGLPSLILDANERVGDSWRRRWPSLRLYSSARNDELPGMRFPAPSSSFPTAGEMADYLEAYAERHELPVRSGVAVDELHRDGDGYVALAGTRRFEADNVIVATGAFTDPYTPDFAAELDPAVRQLHSNDYRSPGQLQKGTTLVVGAAHSGADIAYEVAATRPTLLSGRETGQLPFPIDSRRGRAIWPLLRFAWMHVLTVRTPIGRKARRKIRSHGGPLLRIRSGDLEAAGVERVPRTAGVEGGMPILEDGRVVEAANVVWCTGFRNDYAWIHFPLPLDEDGFPAQERGAVAGLPGLYFAGLLFLDSFSSMLILGAGRDARRVVDHIAAHRSGARREAAVASA